jgi:hypothetical protein
MLKNDKKNKIAKRLAEFNYWIKTYKKQVHSIGKGVEISFIDNAAQILNDVYWSLVENYVRPMVNAKEETNGNGESNISRFKIISTMELTIMKVFPIKSTDEESERRLNALFAYYTGITILRSYEPSLKDETFRYIDSYKESFDNIEPNLILSIREEHIRWLAYLDTRATMPIISNAQTWRLFNLCLLALENKLLHEPKTNLTKKRTRRHP